MAETDSPQLALPPVTVQTASKGYRLVCPSLGVSCTAVSLDAGYAALLEIAAASGMATVNDSVTEDYMQTSSSQSAVVQVSRRNPLHTALLLAIAAVGVPVLVLTALVLNDVRFLLKQTRTVAANLTAQDAQRDMGPGSLAITRIADALSRLTPERQEELRRSLEMISLKLAPIAEGARPLFEAVGMAPPKAAPVQPQSDGGAPAATQQ